MPQLKARSSICFYTTAFWAGSSATGKEFPASSTQQHVTLRLVVLSFLTVSLSDMNNVSLYVLAQQLIHCLYLSLWTQNPRVHSPVVRAADCRSAGPWFNSGRRSWIHTHWHIQRNNIMSPITTTITMPITTITRKSVNMVAELALWIPDTTERQEDYSAVAKATTVTAVAFDTKARAAQGTVVQLKSELAQSQQSRTEAKTQADSLSLNALNPPSDFGADTVVDRIPGRLTGESLDRLGNPTFSMTLQTQSSLFDWTRIS